jgi:hypothetical protein
MRLALKMARVAKGGYLQAAREQMQYIIK